MQIVSLSDGRNLPFWRRPVTLLFMMAAAMPIAFATWSALLNNFVIEVAEFDGSDIGWLHTVREIPGFFAIAVIVLLMLFREQVLGLVSLVMLGVATALQWIDKAKAPQVLGWLIAAGSGATFLAYVLIVLTWEALGLSYSVVYWASGGITALVGLYCLFAYPQFEGPTPQRKEFVLRKRYWLYYALQFMSGARRQIFVVFAGFMMVEKFGYAVHEITGLFLITLLANIVTAPLVGKAVGRFGERNALVFEYVGLAVIFFLYGGLYYFGWGVVLAAMLYVFNNIFFSLALAIKTYFQKIADPADIAPTAAVAFTINHIAAVFLPAGLGYLWLKSPELVFVAATFMALGSLGLSLLIPRDPVPGQETIFARGLAAPAE